MVRWVSLQSASDYFLGTVGIPLEKSALVVFYFGKVVIGIYCSMGIHRCESCEVGGIWYETLLLKSGC